MKSPPTQIYGWHQGMSRERSLRRVHEEIEKFEKTMEELRILKSVSEDLKSYRRMIKIKKYD
jgi:pilus assembly protein TadC